MKFLSKITHPDSEWIREREKQYCDLKDATKKCTRETISSIDVLRDAKAKAKPIPEGSE